MVKSEWDKLLTGIAKWERERAAFSEVRWVGQLDQMKSACEVKSA